MANDAALITLLGEIDLTRKSELQDELGSFRKSTFADVEVDMSGVTFFGSEGVGFLVRLFMEAQTRGGTVTLVHPSAAVLRLIKITGLGDLIRSRVSLAAVAPAPEPAPGARGRRAVRGLRG